MDFERMFLKKHGILKWDEYTVLNSDRVLVEEKISKKVITEPELLLQFRVELSLLNSCKQKIQDELQKTDEVIETQILVLLCKRIIDLFDHMHVLFSIKKDMLSIYISVCQDNVTYINAEQLDILLDAVLCFGDDQRIWVQLLKLHLKLNNLDKLMNVFREGVRSLKENSLPLWKMLIRHLGNRRPDMVKTLLEEGSNVSYENISLVIRPIFLKWCIEFEGIDVTRNVFNELKDLNPPCCKLYLTMIAIESEEPDFELDTARKLYNDVCALFGRDNIGVWMDYVRFEHTKGSQTLKRRVCNKALFNLEFNLKDIFVHEYQNIERDLRKHLCTGIIVIDD